MKRLKFALLAVLSLWASATAPWRKPRHLCFNTLGGGTHPTGGKTYLADAAITSRYRVVKVGTDSSHVAEAAHGDLPLGVCTDQPAAAEDDVNVDLFGAKPGTITLISGAAIAVDDFVVLSATAGKVRTLPATTGTYYIIGRAVGSAAAADEEVECIPIPVIQRVVA